MATKDFKIRHSLTVSENATIEGNLTLGGNTVSRVLDSDEVINIINENVTGLSDSDLKVVADLRNDVDSDSLKLQTLETTVSGLSGGGTSNIISPVAFAFVNTTSNGSGTGISWSNWNSSNHTLDFTFDTAQPNTNYAVITDCDLYDNYYVGISNKTTTGFRAEFYDDTVSRTPGSASPFTFLIYGSNPNVLISGSVNAGFDSDQVVAIINENVVSGSVDSDVAAIAQLRRDADSDSLRIQEIATSLEQINELVDSDLKAIADLRNDVDSDSIKLQSLSVTVDELAGFAPLTITRYDYTATQSQTVFSGDDDNGNSLSYVATKIQVYLNGILLLDGTDYTATNGTSLTLIQAADSDDRLSIIKYLGADAAASDNINVTRFTYKVVSAGVHAVGDSEFTGADDNGNVLSYVAGKIQVYSNGILLEDSDDYVATDGSSIVLRAAPDSDDVVTIFKYLGTTQSGFDSDQVVAIINENLPVDQTGFDSDQVVAIINENSSGGGVLSIDADDNIISSNTTSAITAGSGLSNIAIGSTAGDAITTGDYNVAIGNTALSGATTNGNNIAIGRNSLQSGNPSVAIALGFAAASTSGGSSTISIGQNAHNSSTNPGPNSIAIGNQAGRYTYTTSGEIIAIGTQAGAGTAAGFGWDKRYSILIGYRAGYATGLNGGQAQYNIAIGYQALDASKQGTTMSGDENIVIGRFAGASIASSTGNIAMGTNALNTGSSTGCGSSNIGIGDGAGGGITSGGFSNICLGLNAGNTNIGDGDYNTVIGYNCTTAGANQQSVVIGYNLTGKGNYTGFFGGTSANYNAANTSSWNTTSDERIKTNVTNYTTGLTVLDQVNVKTYNYLSDSDIATAHPELADSDGLVHEGLDTEKTIVGIMAQELETVLPNSVTTRENGIKSVNKDELFWVMLNSIKELKARVEALENN